MPIYSHADNGDSVITCPVMGICPFLPERLSAIIFSVFNILGE